MLSARKYSFRSVRAAFLLIAAFSALYTLAQNSTEDVHIQPRPQPAPKAEIDPGLRSHSKPLTVNVEMVLVPVTITDPINRLFTGLHRETFNLFGATKQQEIKTF